MWGFGNFPFPIMYTDVTGKQYKRERDLSTRKEDSITFYNNFWKYHILGFSAEKSVKCRSDFG